MGLPKPIYNLDPYAGTPLDTDIFPVQDGGGVNVAKKLTLLQVKDYIGNGFVNTVNAQYGVYADNTDPLNPILELGGALGTAQAVTAQLSSNREIYMDSHVLFFSLDSALVNGASRVAEIIPSDPFLVPNMGGFQVTEDLTTFGATGVRTGYSMITIDGDKTMAWLRRTANDGYYFGTTYGNSLGALQTGFTFFDDGAPETHITVGSLDSAPDLGFMFNVNGNMSIVNVLPTAPLLQAGLSVFVRQVSNNSQVIDALVNNGLSFDISGSSPQIVLGNALGEPTNAAEFHSDRYIYTAGFTLNLTDNGTNFLELGNTFAYVQNTAGYSGTFSALQLSYSNPGGTFVTSLSSEYVDLNDSLQNQVLLSTTTVKLSNLNTPTAYLQLQYGDIKGTDGVNYTMNLFNSDIRFENLVTNDYADYSNAAVQLSNGGGGGSSQLTRTTLAVNAPPGYLQNGVADFVGGGITTQDPSVPAAQARVWLLGNPKTAAVTVDNTQYLEVSVGGVTYKLVVAL